MADSASQIFSNLAKVAEHGKIKKVKPDHGRNKSIPPIISDTRKESRNTDMDFINTFDEPSAIHLPTDSQESVILEDLITCFRGRNGEFITANQLTDPYGPRTFTISDYVEPKIRSASTKCLKLASHYSLIVRFIQDNRLLHCGRVNQALSAAMESIIDMYSESVIELESSVSRKSVSLHSLWYRIQPMMGTLSFLSDIALRIVKKGAKGGKTLSILHKVVVNSAPLTATQKLAIHLISQSSAPYLESVQKWIYEGVIFDPFDEFMIVENTRIKLVQNDFSDDYWLKRHQIRKDCVPSFLEEVADQILNAGKYLDAASLCSPSEKTLYAQQEKLEYSLSGDYLETIYNAYKFSSKKLLNIVVNDFKVIDYMKSVKRYFLLEQGDFISTVFYLCQEELSKKICDIIPSRFSAFIDIALRIPSTNDDEYREFVVLNLKPIGLVEQVIKILSINTDEEFECRAVEGKEVLTGIDALALSVKYQWPVSLVFSKKVISCYQMLFRHLVYAKYVETLLSKVWLTDMSFKTKNLSQSPSMKRCFFLRHKMTFFVQNMSYFMMTEAIEPNWFDLMAEMNDLESVDDLLKKHWNFLDNCMKDCLLTNPNLLRSFRDILTTCKHFTEFIKSIENKLIQHSSADFEANVITLENRFDEEFLKFLKLVSDYAVGDSSSKMLSIYCRFENLVKEK